MIFKENDQRYVEEIKNGTSQLFPIIPKEIGDVVYCSTDNLSLSKSDKKLKLSKTIKLLVTILIVAAVVGLLSLSGVVFLPIVTGVIGLAVIVYMAVKHAKFNGCNEILGADGFVLQWFENSRDNITNSKLFTFSDMYDIVVKSSYTLLNGVFYEGSKRNYHYWKSSDRNSKMPSFDSYVFYDKDGDNKDINAMPINCEELWTNYRLNLVRPAFDNNEIVYFNYFKGDITYDIFDKYIGVSKNALFIDGKECKKDNIKAIQYENGKLIIKTDQDYITLLVGGIGSFMVFQELLLEFAKNNLPIGVFASLGGDAGSALKDALREKGMSI